MDAERWQRVDDLLQSALQTPAGQQDEFLRQVCGDDTDLLEEVRSLLAAHQEAGSFLEQPEINPANAVTQTSAFSSDSAGWPVVTGQTISHYRVLGRLGSGGMGVVYQAEDIKLGRGVAMKFLPSEVASDRVAYERLQREARAASTLDHPNICSIYELGEHEGQPFIAMQLLEGQTLRDWIESSPQQDMQSRLNRALDLAIQIANGLEAAHHQGVIHRDIKPANIFITKRGDAKILDFGLAKLIEDTSIPEPTGQSQPAAVPATTADPQKLHLTRTGTTMGTAYYMSPEQVRGEKLDARTDLFSLGLVLYEMMTGQRAFTGKTGSAVHAEILNQVPTPVRQLNPSVPVEMERIINRAIEKDRDRRYRTADEVAKDLEGLRQVLRPAASSRIRKWMMIAAAALLVALAVPLGVLVRRSWGGNRAGVDSSVKTRRSIAVLGFDNFTPSPETDWLSTGLSQMLATDLAAGGDLRLIPGDDVARAKSELHISESGVLSRYNLGRLRKNLGTDDVVFGSYTVDKDGGTHVNVRMQDATNGNVVAALTEVGNENKLYDLVSLIGDEMRHKLGAGDAPASEANGIKAALPANAEAARLYSKGLERLRSYDSLEARDLFLKAAELDPNHAGTHLALAEAWRFLGYTAKAKDEAQKAVDLSADRGKEDLLWAQGQLHEIRHEYDDAANAYRTLLKSHPDGLEYGLRLATVQVNAGKPRDALATLDQLRNLPSPFREDPRIDLIASDADSHLGDYKQAQILATRAEQVARAQERTLIAARAIANRCDAQRNLGDFQLAVASCEDAYRIFNDAGDRTQAAAAVNSIALILQDKGDLAGARAKYEEALAIARKTGNKKDEAHETNNLASNLWAQGDLAGAEENYERSLKTAMEIDDKLSATNTLGNIGLVLVSMEDFPGARAKYGEALALAHETGNKKAEASNEIHLAELLYVQGDLAGMVRALQSSDALLEGSGDKRHHLYTLFSWGDVLSAQDDLSGAQKKLQEALEVSKQMGAKDLVAYTKMVLANLAVEQGRPKDAVVLAQAATDEYDAEKSRDFEVQAMTSLVNAQLENGAASDAAHTAERLKTVASTLKDPLAQVAVTTVSARTVAAAGNPRQAIAPLRHAIAEAHRHGALGYEFEARLALGEIELHAGMPTLGRSDLDRLQKEARTRGFLLIARKANLALNNRSLGS